MDYIKDLQVFWLGETINPRTGLKGYKSEWTEPDLENIFNLKNIDINEINETLKIFQGR